MMSKEKKNRPKSCYTMTIPLCTKPRLKWTNLSDLHRDLPSTPLNTLGLIGMKTAPRPPHPKSVPDLTNALECG